MNFSECLKAAWKEVEKAYNDGYMVNESMMAFVLFKALTDQRPDLRFVYDARIDSEDRYRPDLVVWQGGPEPEVLFVCELKFVPDNYVVYEPDIEKLQHINKKKELAVRTRNPITGDLLSTLMPKSGGFTFGFFVIANWDAGAVVFDEVTATMSEEERAIFHFAYGSIPGNKDEPIQFEYQSPSSE